MAFRLCFHLITIILILYVRHDLNGHLGLDLGGVFGQPEMGPLDVPGGLGLEPNMGLFRAIASMGKRDVLLGNQSSHLAQALGIRMHLHSATVTPSIMEKHVAAMFHEILIWCLPDFQQSVVEKGHFMINQKNFFQLHCDQGMTRPLHTFQNWTCDPNWIIRRGYYIPSMCIPKELPTEITMKRKVSLTGLKNSKCGTRADLKEVTSKWRSVLARVKSETFTEDGFKFQFNRDSLGGRCSGSFNADGFFKESVRLRFEVSHTPSSFFLKPSTRDKVQGVLDRMVEQFLTQLRDNLHLIENYTMLENKPMFFAGKCRSKAGMVQRDERRFHTEIPTCRFCDRGMYLNGNDKTCYRCPRGTYSHHSGADCIECPLVEADTSVSADGIEDCYAITICDHCTWHALEEGLVIIIIYHAICLAVVAWNLRSVIPSATGKDVDSEDKNSRKRSF